MNQYFHAVKFDAELKDTVRFANKIYGYKGAGSRVTNNFTIEYAARQGGRLGYPTMTIISPMGEKISVEGGYKDPAKMVLMLRFFGEGYYKEMDFQTFLFKKPQDAVAPEFSD
jgi:thioredoxin-related protein